MIIAIGYMIGSSKIPIPIFSEFEVVCLILAGALTIHIGYHGGGWR